MKSVISIFLVMLLFSCNDSKKEEQNSNSESNIEVIEGYFPNNDIEFSQPVKVIITSNKEDFERYFGIAKTMSNTISEIDFDNNKVVAIIARPLDKKQTISILETKLKNNKLAIKYKLEIGAPQSFSSTDLKMLKIPKSINAIDVYTDEGEQPKSEN